MTLRIDWVTVDSNDPHALARFWAEALDYDLADGGDDEDALIVPRDGSKRRVLFLKVPDAKTVKYRLHFDLRPDDQSGEVARLEAMGARRVDIGQAPDSTWIVMADPEGNEFCVLGALRPDQRGAPWGD